jgi:hypothetical protein
VNTGDVSAPRAGETSEGPLRSKQRTRLHAPRLLWSPCSRSCLRVENPCDAASRTRRRDHLAGFQTALLNRGSRRSVPSPAGCLSRRQHGVSILTVSIPDRHAAPPVTSLAGGSGRPDRSESAAPSAQS